MKERKLEDLALQISIQVIASMIRERDPDKYHEEVEDALKKLKKLEKSTPDGKEIMARVKSYLTRRPEAEE